MVRRMATLMASLKPSAPTAMSPTQNSFDKPKNPNPEAKPPVAITATAP